MIATSTKQPLTRLVDLAWLIDAEYKEMPGMRLTFAQVKRLWNLSTDECRQVLDYLVSSGRLTRDDDDRYCRQVEAF